MFLASSVVYCYTANHPDSVDRSNNRFLASVSITEVLLCGVTHAAAEASPPGVVVVLSLDRPGHRPSQPPKGRAGSKRQEQNHEASCTQGSRLPCCTGHSKSQGCPNSEQGKEDTSSQQQGPVTKRSCGRLCNVSSCGYLVLPPHLPTFLKACPWNHF